jgi:hypothetical protein
MSKVRIGIKKNGQRTIEAECAPGTACQQATAPYESRIRGHINSDEPTAEAYQEPVDQEEQEFQ